MPQENDLRIGRLALEKGLLKQEDFERALAEQTRNPSADLGAVLHEMGLLPRETVDALRQETPPEGPRLGKYVLLGELGRGGMGVVHKAWDPTLGRLVAVKSILETGDPETARRLEREAQTAAKLSHPHIVPIYEVGRQDGKPYLAMKFVDGETLHDLRLEPRAAMELMEEVARTVHFAHEQGIVHRDLKPHNLMRERGGHVWVMDFGLAREVKAGSTLTATGAVVGTPAYMSPEQAAGAACDRRSDVYSLGATLYQILTGHPPFEGSSPLEVLRRMVEDDPVPPRRHDRGIHPEAETIVLKAMAREPERRYATAEAFAEDLRRHLQGRPILAMPPTLLTRVAKKIRRHPAAAALLFVIAAGTIAATAAVAGSKLRLRREVAALRLRAAQEESAGRYDEAIKLFQTIAAKDGSQEWAPPRIRELELKRDARARGEEQERKRGQARALLSRAADERARYEATLERLPGLVREVREHERRIRGPEPAETKRPLWEAQRRHEDARREAEDLLDRTTASLVQAYGIGVDPEREEARRTLAELYWNAFLRAEREGTSDSHASALVRQYDDASGSLAAKLAEPGSLVLETDPAGAEVYLFRYEPGDDRRLMPRPYGLARNESRKPNVETTPDTAYALEFTDFNRLGLSPIPRTPIPQGSYMLVLRRQGHRDTRYPVRIRRAADRAARVKLRTDEQIGDGFVYVPAGPFVVGGDPLAYSPLERDPDARTGDFFIAKHEVTVSDYFAFLNRGIAEGKDMRPRAPRNGTNGGFYMKLPDTVEPIAVPGSWDPLWPIFGVSWEDANAYCEWRTRTAKDGAAYRLPTGPEWEKAARGADGRFFPWGDRFDWSFAKGLKTREGLSKPERAGACPADESPYGVRDMAGSMSEHCEDWYDEAIGIRLMHGGAWGQGMLSVFRCASRVGFVTNFGESGSGFRMVRVPR
ncbi:MAG: SUMF1/EgtB/PvdO family nonheme iron enzyme [Planctomycetes bacterium]|nr:SUMF1/EgtB/PvdO family nonheme iron enzyme [Planctomycetota bacterium]